MGHGNPPSAQLDLATPLEADGPHDGHDPSQLGLVVIVIAENEIRGKHRTRTHHVSAGQVATMDEHLSPRIDQKADGQGCSDKLIMGIGQDPDPHETAPDSREKSLEDRGIVASRTDRLDPKKPLAGRSATG